MVNILSVPDAAELLEEAIDLPSPAAEEDKWVNKNPGRYKLQQEKIFEHGDADPLASLQERAAVRVHHKAAPLWIGHVVRPGSVSLYSKYVLVYYEAKESPDQRKYVPERPPCCCWKETRAQLARTTDAVNVLINTP